MIDFTGPQPALKEPEPLVSGRRARHGDRGGDTPDEAGPGRRMAGRRSRETEPEDAGAEPRARRRVGWRKGSDVDEELWPAEAFGGVSDEQFWDDLASDKPLATTARTAQPEAGARRRRPNAGPLPDLYPAEGRGRADSSRTDSSRTDNSRTDSSRGSAEGPGTHPQPRLGPDDRTAIQPAQTGPQPTPVAPVTPVSPVATQPSPAFTQPSRASHQPAEPRGRSRAGAEDDPLTSPAYSLRPRGSVDGRGYSSARRSGDTSREPYAAAGQETQSFSVASTQSGRGGYPDGGPASRQYDRPSYGANGRGRSDGYRPDPLRPDPPRTDPLRTDPLRPDPLRGGDGYGSTGSAAAYPYPQQPYGETSTPPYGERYGYQNPAEPRDHAAQRSRPGSDPRRASGGWSTGDGQWGSRPAQPPANGYRGPQDAWGYDRRLSMR